MAASAIADDLLRTAIGLRVDAGVSASKIEGLITKFASGKPHRPEGGDGLLGVGVREVPQNRREDLLKAIAGLPPEPDYSPANAMRTMSASDVWPLRIAEDAKMHRTGPLNDTAPNLDRAPEPADPDRIPAPVERISQDAVDGEQQPAEPLDQIVVSNPASPAIEPEADSTEGVSNMWDQGELERMKKEIGLRREEILGKHAEELKEMLASHAEELRQLDADHRELEALEQAIVAALRKFKPSSGDAAVIMRLDEERALRQQGLS